MKRELTNWLPGGELDYLGLHDKLADYANPRDKISRYLKEGSIIQVKKGLYVLADENRTGPICRESLANLIYGPSYISLEYALSYYNMIPERVETITSVTTQKTKTFQTPVGRFSYRHLPLDAYSVGIRRESVSKDLFFLIATKEKALCDLFMLACGTQIDSEITSWLIEDRRMEWSDLRALSQTHLRNIASAYKSPALERLRNVIRGSA